MSHWKSMRMGSASTHIVLMVLSFGLDAPSIRSAYGAPPAGRYEVREGCNLREISLRLYGTPRYWRQIAAWNGIRGPKFSLHRGRVLILRRKPRLMPEQGAQRVLDFWRERLKTLSPDSESKGSEDLAPAPPPEQVRMAFASRYDQIQSEAAATGVGPSLDEIQNGKSRDVRFAEAQELFKRGHFEKARDIFADLRSQDSGRPQFWLREMACLMSLQKFAEARRLALEFKDRVPELKGLPFLGKILKTGDPSASEATHSRSQASP